MKKIYLAFILVLLAGCQTETTEIPPVVTDQPLVQTESPLRVQKIVLDEWFDYGCHHCHNMHDVIKDLKKKYGDQLEIREHHFPLSAQTFVFAEASECARAQGKFAEFHDEVFTNYYGQFQVGNISKAATAAGVPDLDTFNTCVSSGAQKDKVVTDVREAEKLGVRGTPFFMINNELSIPGAVGKASFEKLFDELLES